MIDFYNEVLCMKDDLLKDLKMLCQIPSVYDKESVNHEQPFGKDNRIALNTMLDIGKRDGYIVDDCDHYAGSIDIGEGDNVLGILGHLDVVPVNENGWNYPPFDCTLDHDTLYGRGVADDKGPLLAAYYASKIIDKLEFKKKYKIRVIFGTNEERGSSCVKYYFKHRPSPEIGFTPDASFPVVYGEKALANYILEGDYESDVLISLEAGTVHNIVPDNAKAVLFGEKSQYEESFYIFLDKYKLEGNISQNEKYVEIVLKGKSAHGSTPDIGINAVTYLCHYLHSIINDQVVEIIDTLFFNDTKGVNLKIAHTGAIGELTNNVGVVTYKDNHLSIILDMRYSNECIHEDILKKIQSIIHPLGLTESHSFTDALYVNPNSTLIQSLHQAYVDYTDDTTPPQTMGGGTYAKEMKNCVAFGPEFPGKDNCIHQDNEHILLDDLLLSAAIYAKALYYLLKE